MSLVQGPVVFIDDEVSDEAKPAYALAQQIRATGRPIAEYEELPPDEHSEHWRSIAFLVLDWDLVPGSPGALGGSTLSDFARSSLFEWLERFIEKVFCPIFIISAEDVADIERQLNDNASLQRLVGTGRVKVFPKQTLMENFLQYLEEWITSTPALAALNIWENENESAKNRLFQDMDQLAPDWPAYVWKNAGKDGIDPSYELASVISANLLHRMDTLRFDVDAIREFDGDPTREAMRRVIQGRTTLPGARLYPTMILPGDLFSDSDDGVVWVNVTPACHTVISRTEGSGEDESGKVHLNLVRGQRLERPKSKSAFGKQKNDYDGPNGMLVHVLLGDEPYAFSFKSRRMATWNEVSEQRIGRLLPPYITLLQQRHAAFLMNEGLPRVDPDLYLD